MKNIRKYIILLMLLLIIGLIITYGLTYGRYVSDSVWDYYLKSKGFYFSSETLSTSTYQNVNNVWEKESIHFNLKNYINNSLITNYDISYEATCTILDEAAEHTSCYLDGTSLDTVSGVLSSSSTCINNTSDGINTISYNKTQCELEGYNWTIEKAVKDIYFDIVLNDSEYEVNDIKVKITISSTSPYKKVITGIWDLHNITTQEDKILSNYTDYNDYGRLILSNAYLANKCVKVKWDASKYRIENQAYDVIHYDENDYINEINFILDGKKNSSIIYYKTNLEENHNLNDFIIESEDTCE